jgi:hypothetical protein
MTVFSSVGGSRCLSNRQVGVVWLRWEYNTALSIGVAQITVHNFPFHAALQCLITNFAKLIELVSFEHCIFQSHKVK